MNITVNDVVYDFTRSPDQLTRAVIISLFSWRRATADDDTQEVMGWWGDTFPDVANDRIGSRLYLLSRTTITNQTANEARGYITEALQWLIDDGVSVRNDVKCERTGQRGEQLAAQVAIYQSDGTRHAISFTNLWEAFA
jgi:phage gp46-like protein